MSLEISLTVSAHFLAWLFDEQVSLAFTTYQSNRLFLLGLKNGQTLSTFERLFDRPMGLAVHDGRLYMSTRTQIWQLSNALAKGSWYEGYDALYVPRQSYVTGNLDVHDVAQDHLGRLVFINTLYSCLATVSQSYSFEYLWKPKFISQLAAEDRCHLNGLAMLEGEPRYVTAVSRSDVASGWRARRQNGGCLIDVQNDEIVLKQLSMPHSPRSYNSQLWLLNSGAGEIGYADLSRNTFEPVLFCPGYLRGMAIYKHFAIVGLSKPRYNQTFTGLPLQEQLQRKDADAICGLYIYDLERGELAHWVQLEGIVTELYDVVALPGVRCPQALGFKSDEIERFISFQEGTRVYTSQLPYSHDTASPQNTEVNSTQFALPPASKIVTPSEERKRARRSASEHQKTVIPAKRERKQAPSLANSSQYHFQVSFDMTVETVRQHFTALTYPNLQQEMQRKQFHEPLIAILASHQGEAVGMVLAECHHPPRGQALLSSLFVVPRHREKGIGKTLLYYLEQALIQKQITALDWVYRTDWKTYPIIENLMRHYGWLPPQSRLYQYRLDAKTLLTSAAFAEAKLAPGLKIFPWAELTPKERSAILARQEREDWYPSTLDPFQLPNKQSTVSVGLRRGEEIVGWMLCHQNQPDTIQYSALFLSAEERNKLNTIHGKVIPLIKGAIERQSEQQIPKIIFQVQAENKTMLTFTARYLSIAQLKESEVRISQKNLSR